MRDKELSFWTSRGAQNAGFFVATIDGEVVGTVSYLRQVHWHKYYSCSSVEMYLRFRIKTFNWNFSSPATLSAEVSALKKPVSSQCPGNLRVARRILLMFYVPFPAVVRSGLTLADREETSKWLIFARQWRIITGTMSGVKEGGQSSPLSLSLSLTSPHLSSPSLLEMCTELLAGRS